MKEQQFTGDWFENLLKGIKSNKSEHDDKRSSPRVGVTMSVEMCFITADGQPQRAGSIRLRDVGRSGISFIYPKRMKPGVDFCLSFPRLDEAPLLIGYKSMRCRLVGDDLYNVGASLTWIGTPPKAAQSQVPPALQKPTSDEDEIARIRNAMLG